MNEDLKFTFNNINEWLKFAEAKNAGLLAFNVATIIGVLQSHYVTRKEEATIIVIIVLLLCLSSCICIYAILPIINKYFRFYKKLAPFKFENSKAELNALFFGDIAKLSSDQFIKLFEYKHKIELNHAEKDLGSQITNNAEICWQKYYFFSISGCMSFSTFAFAIVYLFCNSVYRL